MGELTSALSTKDERRTQRRENENMPAAKKVAVPAHPPYEKMVKAALVALKDRTGSSTQAIAKYMKANYDLPENFAKSLSRFLKKFVESGKLVKVKASYKLGSLKTEPKPNKKKVAKKKAPKKTTAPKKKVAKKPKKPKKKVVKKKK